MGEGDEQAHQLKGLIGYVLYITSGCCISPPEIRMGTTFPQESGVDPPFLADQPEQNPDHS